MTDNQKKATIVVLAAGLLAWLLWPKKAKAATVSQTGDVITEPPVKLPEETTMSYTVQRGDSYSKIAATIYGDGTYKLKGGNDGWKWWPLLWDMNKHITGCNQNLIKPGQVLTIPKPTALPMDRRDAVFARAPNWRNPPSICGT